MHFIVRYSIHETSAAGKLQVPLPKAKCHRPRSQSTNTGHNVTEGRLGAELAAEARSLPTPFNDGLRNDFEKQLLHPSLSVKCRQRNAHLQDPNWGTVVGPPQSCNSSHTVQVTWHMALLIDHNRTLITWREWSKMFPKFATYQILWTFLKGFLFFASFFLFLLLLGAANEPEGVQVTLSLKTKLNW